MSETTKEIKNNLKALDILTSRNKEVLTDIRNKTENIIQDLANEVLSPSKSAQSSYFAASNIYTQSKTKNPTNMSNLSSDTYKILKRIPNISSDDSKNEIRENIEKLRNFGKRIPKTEIKEFLEALAPLFDCSIREAIEEEKEMTSIDEICDFVLKKFVLKGNFEKKLEELKKMKKKKNESYADFGTRLIKFKNDLIKMAKYKEDESRFDGRKTHIEDTALSVYLKILKKYISYVFNYGRPKTIEQTKIMVEKAEERFAFSEEENSESGEETKKDSKINFTHRSRHLKCQLCDGNNFSNKHEALLCTISPCIYCSSSFHTSNDCSVVTKERKIVMLCKLCSSQRHTIDFCPNKTDNITYCQICQDSRCFATKCNKLQSCKTCAICGEKEHNYGQNCPMNNVVATRPQQMPQKRILGPCYTCGGPHLNNSCPQRASTSGYNPNPQNHQAQNYKGQYRGQFNNRGGLNYNRGQFNNNSRTFYQSGSQNLPQRGNYQNRGNFRGNFRGGYYQNQQRNMNPNYQPQNQNRRPTDQELFTLQKFLQHWMAPSHQGLTNETGINDQNPSLPKITFPQNEPKN